ncbi:MAG: hypothetical protein ICV66_04485 [Chitinophagaceae bacterium]|nr:hypothetical protein [Chitinophagaceae bacterium]
MPNRNTDALFQLVHSLQKWEKRNFKLYAKRNTSSEELRVIQLFDTLEKMKEYDEAVLLEKTPSIKKQQLSNVKALLYKQLLSSLTLLESNDNIDIQLHEQLDFARILYNKGLYLQSLKILDKIKETAKYYNQVTFLTQVLFLEKKIESLHITRSIQDKAEQLTTESRTVNEKLIAITELSNLSLQLYSWYIKHGHARNKNDEEILNAFFRKQLTENLQQPKTFYEKLYLYQCYCWYAFIRQDYLMYYRYTQKWVDLFHAEPSMINIETPHYIKGMHNLLNAHFYLSNYEKFDNCLLAFEEFAGSEVVKRNTNNIIQVFVYLYTAKINQHFMHGTFEEGLILVPDIKEKLKEFKLHLDGYRVLVFYYKIASLYFGCGDYENSVTYLSKIINWKVDLRDDLQCYARLLHLIAHYELGNLQLLEYLVKSVYRFMAKMENLGSVEEEIFIFLRRAFNLTASELKPEFENLLARLKQLENNHLATRSFAYLDFISWLESKIEDRPVSEVIRRKYLSASEVVSSTSNLASR